MLDNLNVDVIQEIRKGYERRHGHKPTERAGVDASVRPQKGRLVDGKACGKEGCVALDDVSGHQMKRRPWGCGGCTLKRG